MSQLGVSECDRPGAPPMCVNLAGIREWIAASEPLPRPLPDAERGVTGARDPGRALPRWVWILRARNSPLRVGGWEPDLW